MCRGQCVVRAEPPDGIEDACQRGALLGVGMLPTEKRLSCGSSQPKLTGSGVCPARRVGPLGVRMLVARLPTCESGSAMQSSESDRLALVVRMRRQRRAWKLVHQAEPSASTLERPSHD